MSQLDVDEITRSKHRSLPPIRGIVDPPFSIYSQSGTVVRLLRCDRLEYKRVSTIVRHLRSDLGRIFRHFIGTSFDLTVNGSHVAAIDPLMLDRPGLLAGTRQFGDMLVYRLDAEEGEGRIEVRFSELPVERWQGMPSTEKRRLGITGSPSVSILRADREIDRGWFFMGTKRRENYDDWWRCEIRFDPVLDELFGITHAKQAIAPTQELIDLLGDDLEPIARALNSRIRRRFELLKISTPLGKAEKRASLAEDALPPLPQNPEPAPPEVEQALAAFEPAHTSGSTYQLVVTDLPTTTAFEAFVKQGRLIVALNSHHPLYRDLYGPLACSDSDVDQEVATHVALTVLAAARAEWLAPRKASRAARQKFRQVWSDVLATFFNVPA